MPAHLLIRDGSPEWWESLDVWVVPGPDPNGPPGNPVAGNPAYLWAHVANTGDTFAENARIDFYWANPATQVVQGVATQVGSSYVNLPAGAAQDVLCLTPWLPTFVNGGHECILAVAHSAAESPALPDPLPPGFDFNPPAYDEIAQRNLSVLQVMEAPLAITVSALARADKVATLGLRLGGTLHERALSLLGLDGFRAAPEDAVEAGLAHEPRCRFPEGHRHEHEIVLRVPRGTSSGVYLTVHPRNLPGRHYALVRIFERIGEKIVGGITYVAVHRRAADEGEMS